MGSFCSHIITDIQTLVSIYYTFYRQADTLNYIMNLLYENKFFYNNIKNVSNKKLWYEKSCLWINKIIYIYKFKRNF